MRMASHRRRLERLGVLVVTVFASALLLAVFAAPAAAKTPMDDRLVQENVPLGEFDVVIEPEVGCADFAVEVNDVAGKIRRVVMPEGRHGNAVERVTWHTTTRYTNLETGATFERRFNSILTLVLRPDGSEKTIVRNDILVWYGPDDPSELGRGVWLIDHGHVVEEYDAAGNLVASDVTRGEVTSICAALS